MLEVQVRKLEDVRTELLLTQKQLAANANVAISVVVNCENGRAIRRLSASALLKALNQARGKEGLAPLAFKDIDWKLSGEEDR